jgi:hypothetical protein
LSLKCLNRQRRIKVVGIERADPDVVDTVTRFGQANFGIEVAVGVIIMVPGAICIVEQQDSVAGTVKTEFQFAPCRISGEFKLVIRCLRDITESGN